MFFQIINGMVLFILNFVFSIQSVKTKMMRVSDGKQFSFFCCDWLKIG